MSARSLETTAVIIKVAQGGEYRVQVKQAGLVLNRVRNDELEEELIKKIELDVFGCMPEEDYS